MDSLIKARGHAKGKLTAFKGYIQRVIDGSPDITEPLEDTGLGRGT